MTSNATRKSHFSIWRNYAGSITLVALTTLAAARAFQVDTSAFIVVVHEAQMDLSDNGITADDCLVVLPDGRVHLERKAQQLPQAEKQLIILESSLDTSQIQRLREILNDKAIVDLPPEVVPKLPINTSWFRGFSATIPRADKVQSVGYFNIPEQNIPHASANYIADDTRKVWANSQMRLRSLVEWAHNVESMKLTPSKVSSTFCSVSADSPESSDN